MIWRQAGNSVIEGQGHRVYHRKRNRQVLSVEPIKQSKG
jgi:hypothetical protein